MKIIFTHLVLIFVICVFCGLECAAQDPQRCGWTNNCNPCEEGNHYILDDPSRSYNYYNPDEPLLDNDYLILPFGWYRSVIPGAPDMAFYEPEENHCQTNKPVYLNANTYPFNPHNSYGHYELGGHAYRGGIYYTGSGDFVHIVNCDRFNIYHIEPNVNGAGRYCFGGPPLQCPNDYGPCNDHLDWFEHTAYPVISHVAVEQELSSTECQQVPSFTCDIDLGNISSNVEVIWSVDNQTIKEEIISYDDLPSVLGDGDLMTGINNTGYMLKCQVRVQNESYGSSGHPVLAEYYVGLKLVSTNIELTEGSGPVDYVVHSTVPFGCVYPCAERDTYLCEERIPIKISSDILDQIALQSDDSDTDSCSTTVLLNSSANQLPQLRIPLYARQDGRYDGIQIVNFQPNISTTGIPFLSNTLLPAAKVIVYDEDSTIAGKTCTFYNDPHAKSLDGNSFEMQLAGFFTVYKHTSLPLEIQAYFQDYERYTGTCGLAVRSGNDLFVVNYCATNGLVSRFYECDNSMASNSITVSRLGSSYMIYLPTGGKVETARGRIIFYPSVSDIQHTEGLCGSLNNNPKDDFKLRGENTIIDYTNRYPNIFSESWRVSDDENLFYGNISESNTTNNEESVFCECNSKGTRVCTPQASKQTTINFGSDVSTGRSCASRKRSVVYSDNVNDESEFVFHYNPYFVAPTAAWINGWSNTTATQHCEDFLLSRQSVQTCQGLDVDVTQSLNSCVEDIFITGSTNFTVVQLDMIISQCREEILKNDTLLQSYTANGTTSSLNILLSSLCPSDCSDHGNCSNGECMCNDEYAGYDCSMEKNHIPVLFSLPQGGVCDIASRPCQATPVYADLFIESDNVTCSVQTLNIALSPTSERTFHSAEVEHFQKVFCLIPSATVPYVVNIAVSNNNNDYSQPEKLLIFHSTCWSCSWDRGCQKKVLSCIISDVCYADGETNPTNTNQFCDPNSDQYGWTDAVVSGAKGLHSDVMAAMTVIAVLFVWQ